MLPSENGQHAALEAATHDIASQRRPGWSGAAAGRGWRKGVAAVGLAVLVAACVRVGWGGETRSGDRALLLAPEVEVAEAMRSAHLALQQQRYSLEDPRAAELPPEVARSMNFSAEPCADFYQYVCGSWLKNTEIPPSRGAWSRTWDGAEARVREEVQSLVREQWPASSPFRALNTWYDACMDVARVEALGRTPLQPMLARIANMQTLQDLQQVLVELMVLDSPNFAKFVVSVGYRDKEHNLLFISPAGLTMPDPTWYPNVTFPSNPVQRIGVQSLESPPTSADAHSRDRRHIEQYLETLHLLAGSSAADAALLAEQTIAAETLLAQWQVDEPAFPDALGPEPVALTALEAEYPNVPWRRFLERLRSDCAGFGYVCNEELLGDSKLIVMGAPHFFSQLSSALGTDELRDTHWKPLLRSHYIYAHATELSSSFLSANLRLQSFLEGVSALQPRAEKCLTATTEGLSALTDEAYVKQFFGNASEAQGTALLGYIKAEFVRNLERVTWMDEKTRAHALAKARRMQLNLGGPASYISFPYPVSRESYFNNSVNAVRCRQLRQFVDVGQPRDAGSWKFPASTVNAWYDNSNNALYVPAAMMQKPFFSPDFPPAQNFGAIGAVMAHEMTHGYDDTGAYFDEDREMRMWWSKPAASTFSARARCIQTLYNGLSIDGVRVRGTATLGENIADFGGLKVAYRAYLAWYNATYGGAPTLEDRQLVFVAFGQNWCDKQHSQMQRYLVSSDEHAPSVFRTNVVVSQNADFAETFSCPAGSAMNPEDKCVMWKQIPDTRSQILARAPKDGGEVDEYWVAPPAMEWKGYKSGQKFQAKGWKWLPSLGRTSADNWQFKHLLETRAST